MVTNKARQMTGHADVGPDAPERAAGSRKSRPLQKRLVLRPLSRSDAPVRIAARPATRPHLSMTPQPRTRSRFPALAAARVLLAVALLAAGQVAVAVHDADHPFHAHTSFCDAFLGADTQQPGVAPVAIQAAVAPVHLTLTEIVSQAIALIPYPAFQPRAPPLLPTT